MLALIIFRKKLSVNQSINQALSPYSCSKFDFFSCLLSLLDLMGNWCYLSYYRKKQSPSIIPCSSKSISTTYKTLNIRPIDSLNFLPMALNKLPPCFGITDLQKGFFLHLFNTRENQDYAKSFPDTGYYVHSYPGSAIIKQ